VEQTGADAAEEILRNRRDFTQQGREEAGSLKKTV